MIMNTRLNTFPVCVNSWW